jgi:hypothetical protein
MSKNIASAGKKRNWAFVVYPESAPEKWIEILKQTGLLVAISPLHDKDTNPDEEEKKPHWHVIAIYSGPTSFAVVKSLTDRLNAPIPIALEAVKGYYRYLTHKDNPEKYQYSENEIVCLNGFSILDYSDLTKSDVIKIKKDLQILIMAENFIEYASLMNWVLEKGTDQEYDVACSNTMFFDKYISSRRHQKV